MKASTLFAITIAVLLGLGVVATAKYAGLFSRKPPDLAPVKEPVRILVASQNLFDGMTITAADIRLREVKPGEEATSYADHKDRYLPPMIEAGTLRVLARNVEADQPILKEYLLDSGLPDPLNRRLSSPLMRAVNVAVPAERAGGGLIQIGERVDVFLTTRISVGGDSKRNNTLTQTASIARGLKVIVKRNMLWTAMAPVSTKPIDFTLEANAYRAALIQFAKTKGELTLVPTSAPQKLPGRSVRSIVPASQSDPTNKEYADEDKRIAEFLSGERNVSDADLERIFNLKALARPMYVQVERYDGVQYKGVQNFGSTNNGPVRPMMSEPSFGYEFARPVNGGSGSSSDGDCPTCGKG